MPPFSEVTRIEAAIKNKSAKELEWALWYCRMRQTVPSARPADLKYWGGMEEKVQAAISKPVEMKQYAAKKKKPVRGLAFGPVGVDTEHHS
ncbi:MAG: hypothetical protein ABI158_12920 [Edaphobacter sp.]